MLIEKEKIEEAKVKLGDKTEELIVEILEIDNYDFEKKKCCCPFHKEKTPSFCYDKKRFRFKCFGGCGRSCDIIDALMYKGYSFTKACQKLFEYADIQYDFSEINKKDLNYKYPVFKDFDIKKVNEYLNQRKISCNTIEYLGITADEQGNICFNFYDTNDVLKMCKVRPSHTIHKEKGDCKTWVQPNSSHCNILYNMDKVKQDGTLVICEGEIDCASFIEAGWTQVCSIPFGSQNLHFIDECWDFLEKFDTIIFAGDNDEAGQKFIKEACLRLGAAKTKFIEYPFYKEIKDDDGNVIKRIKTKDANDVLQTFGGEYLINLVLNAKETPITSVTKLSETEELDPYTMEGISTGIKDLDNEIMKIFSGGVTILTGKPSAGKTTFLNQLTLMSMDNDRPVFLFSRELLNGMSKSWFNNVAAGRRNMEEIKISEDKSYYKVIKEAKNKIEDYYDDKFYMYKDDEPNDADSLLASMELCAKRKGIKTFVIDNLMTVDLKCTNENKNEAQTEFINKLINFSKTYKVSVILVAHPRKLQSGQEVDMYDVAGSSNIINLALLTLSLRRVTDKEKEDVKFKYNNYDVIISIIKDRIFGSTKNIPVHYDKISRRFFTSYEEFDRQYKWDDKIYENKILYPVKEPETCFD